MDENEARWLLYALGRGASGDIVVTLEAAPCRAIIEALRVAREGLAVAYAPEEVCPTCKGTLLADNDEAGLCEEHGEAPIRECQRAANDHLIHRARRNPLLAAAKEE